TLANSSSTCIGPGASLQSAKAKYEKAIFYLQDHERTSFIFVLRPESASVLETARSSLELSKLGIQTSFLIVNGILPDEACTDDFFRTKKEAEEKIIQRIKSEFSEVPKTYYPLRDTEVTGIDLLRAVGDFVYEGLADKPGIGTTETKTSDAFDWMNNREDLCSSLFAPANGSRFVFFTGKGGVGKSTVACTAAVTMAEKGYRTLIVTTDPASHLHDIFGQKIGHEPSNIQGVPNLFAARIDQRQALEEYKERIQGAVQDLSEDARRSIEEDLNSPCAEEMAAFEKFMSYFEVTGYDVVIFDTAPTGHTLRLLELPSDWKGFIDLGTLTKQTSGETLGKYAAVIEKMRNAAKSSFVFVMYPEYTPIVEAWRAAEDLKKQVGIETAMVAVNYLLPKDSGDNAFFRKRRRQQDKYLSEIRTRFNKPMLFVPLLDREPKGLETLRQLGQEMCGRN
ncbi:MAG TPA: ArsA family ATPase, partial [Syntrophales bacterium]|nr:ArsA family ATPase [Syntrophales bacterium]